MRAALVINLSKHIALVNAPTYLPDELCQVHYPTTVQEVQKINMDTSSYIVCQNAQVFEYLSTHYTCDIYTTIYENKLPGETFHCLSLQNYEIALYSQSMFSIELQSTYRHIKFTYTSKRHDEHVFLDLLQDILKNGNKRDDRTCVGTCSVFARQLRFNISNSIPVITTKFLPWKMILKELLWFLRGETDSKTLESQGVHIWKENSSRDFLDKRDLNTYREGDIGPMYGFAWRHWGASYYGCDADYIGKGYDQITELVKGLKNDPYSRRHLLTTFNPSDVQKSALAPCHGVTTMFYVEKDMSGDSKGHLSCHVVCRSSDTFLGLSFNIASYSILTYIIAKKCDMKPNELIVSTGDTHIYNTHVQQVNTQLSRTPLPFPILKVSDDVRDKEIHNISLDDFDLIGYIHYPTIKAPMAI